MKLEKNVFISFEISSRFELLPCWCKSMYWTTYIFVFFSFFFSLFCLCIWYFFLVKNGHLRKDFVELLHFECAWLNWRLRLKLCFHVKSSKLCGYLCEKNMKSAFCASYLEMFILHLMCLLVLFRNFTRKQVVKDTKAVRTLNKWIFKPTSQACTLVGIGHLHWESWNIIVD